MGKLLEILKKRQKDLDDYIKTKPKANYVEDPVKGYEFVNKLNELDYIVKQSARMLTDAFIRMTPEQRLQFFNESFNEDRKQSLALSRYRSQLMAAENAD